MLIFVQIQRPVYILGRLVYNPELRPVLRPENTHSVAPIDYLGIEPVGIFVRLFPGKPEYQDKTFIIRILIYEFVYYRCAIL